MGALTHAERVPAKSGAPKPNATRIPVGARARQTPASRLGADEVSQLMDLAGNAAVSRMVASAHPAVVQREFEDADKVAEDTPGVMVGPAGAPQATKAKAEARNEFGEMDGEMTSGVAAHAFTDGGRTGEAAWHHCGGGGGVGNENLGAATLVAPIYKTKAASPGGQAQAWIKKGTGTIKVKRSYTGVTHGGQGPYTPSPGDSVWMSPRGRDRVDTHERKHVKKTKEAYDQFIAPLEKRISTYRGFVKAKKKGADEATAQAALVAEIDWNKSVQDFADMDTQQNTPMGPVDTDDLARADMYQGYATTPAFRAKSTCTLYLGVGASKKKKTT